MSLFDEIKDQARADRLREEAEGKSEAQARASLEAKGVDIEAARAKLEAAIARSEPRARVEKERRPRRTVVAIAFACGAAAFGLLELGLAAGGALSIHVGATAGGPAATTAGASPSAATLRDEALHAFGAGDRATALRRLDEARDIDPAGDKRPEVLWLRRGIEESLADGG